MMIGFNGSCPYGIGDTINSKVNSFNPNNIYPGTTWERIKGKIIVGVDESQPEFNVAGKTGGEMNHTLTENELAAHRHYDAYNVDGNGSHQHNLVFNDTRVTLTYDSGNEPCLDINGWANARCSNSGFRANYSGNHQHTTNGWSNYTGGNAGHNNLQPYITKYIWERTS